MLRVGLTGGLASGKSFVAHILAGLGCHIIEADALGHAVLEAGGEAHDSVLSDFGPEILGGDGAIDRRKLAGLVFEHPERLEILSSLVHPAVLRREELLIAEFAAADPSCIVVVEAAILIETGSFRRFDKLIVICCTPEQQMERAIKRDGVRLDEVRARLDRQMPLEEKRRYADFIVDTSGPKDDTVHQTERVFEQLRRLAQ